MLDHQDSDGGKGSDIQSDEDEDESDEVGEDENDTLDD